MPLLCTAWNCSWLNSVAILSRICPANKGLWIEKEKNPHNKKHNNKKNRIYGKWSDLQDSIMSLQRPSSTKHNSWCDAWDLVWIFLNHFRYNWTIYQVIHRLTRLACQLSTCWSPESWIPWNSVSEGFSQSSPLIVQPESASSHTPDWWWQWKGELSLLWA